MPIARFELPNGKIGRFEVPEGTTPEQAQSMIEAQLPSLLPQETNNAQPAERGYMDMAGDALAQTGRMVVGGATGLAGLLANPLNATTNYVGEAFGYNPNLSTDVRGQAIEQYDAATNNRGKPTDAIGRIAQAGGEALVGGGALGSIAKLAGAAPATVQALGINNIPSAIAEFGAGAGAQTGMEVNPENPILSSLIGGFAGALAPTALANAPRGIAKGFGINPEKIATLEKAGLPVTMPAVSDSDSLKYLSSASQNLPMGGKLKSKIDSAYKRADAALRDLGFTGNVTPAQAGEKAKEGLINWRNQKKSAFKDMDKAFDEIVPKSTPLKPELLGNIQSKINQIVKNNNLTVEQQRELMSHPALSELQSLVNSAKPKDNPAVMSKILDAQGNPTVVTPASQTSQPISIEALDKARANIGLLTEKSPLTPNYDSAITGKAYEIIKDIKKQAVMQTGGEKAVKLLEDKNRFYSKYIDEEKNFNAKLVKKLGEAPEAIFSKMTSNNKVGASEAKRTMARLTGEERDAFRDALIYQKGGGEEFSIGKWAGEYAKMSNDAKNAFFMGKGNLRQAHDDLMQGVTTYKDLGKFKNTSNTAVHNFANKILTGGVGTGVGIGAGAVAGFGNVAGAVVTGGAINKVFSELMSSPTATKTLANILKKPPKTETIFRGSLVKALKATGYTDDTAKQEVDALLKDALAQPAFDTPNNPDGISPQQEPLTLDITPQSYNTQMQEFTYGNEGSRSTVYNDTLGNRTVARGFNLDDKSAPRVWRQAGLSPQLFNQVKRGEAQLTQYDQDALFQASYDVADKDARSYYPDFDNLLQSQQVALIDMSYQMGGNTLKQFKGLHKALKNGDKNAIVSAIRKSKYYEQTPQRAAEVASMLSQGNK